MKIGVIILYISENIGILPSLSENETVFASILINLESADSMLLEIFGGIEPFCQLINIYMANNKLNEYTIMVNSPPKKVL